MVSINADLGGGLARVGAELLLADGGADVAGKFLLRPKSAGSDGQPYILSVIYKGAPTHHAVALVDGSDEYMVNKTPTGKTSLEEVRCIAMLRIRRVHRVRRPCSGSSFVPKLPVS